ncbi:MAE_28990/MAE_18760 family HEPN-like nuclease [Acinetobacter junii]|uniref:MAE_28990/MAE_18760 family HEPN-like nuclease n=1 Tax=Acinetobacter junii TaxID=40215 RepID=UPI0012500C4F|nr:MAE_28990/MAE_18760 family HEPN-like nuclease [Acinetobacter junii]
MFSTPITNPHLLTAFGEFEDKCLEIERFLGLVDDLDAGTDNHFLYKNNENTWQVKRISREVQKTLRASCYLLIYNLLESTTCDALDAIHQTLSSEQIDLQALSNNLKKIIFTNLKEGLGDKSIQEILNQQIDLRIIIMSHGYDKRNFLSGNFDIDAIKKIEKRYGFSLHIVNGQNGTYDPTIIKTIKQKRNALAHGSESFEQCGQNIPVFSMREKYTHAKNTLLALFNGINNFINDKKYLKVTS